MGDCNLAELKELYGDKIILKGNLHTTCVMLNRDAPHENLFAMLETARSYGKY